MSSVREQLVRDGYAVIPGLFTEGRLAEYRDAIDRHFAGAGNIFKLGKTQPNAAVLVPGIASIFHDPGVVAAFREGLGTDRILFTGHCDVHKGMFSGWHKDTGPEHGYFEDDCFAPGCEVYKMGVYLQDHSHGEGLTVVPGSHREPHIRESEAIELRTRAGDAVIFDVRISHRGKISDRIDKVIHRSNQAIKLARAKLTGRPVAKDDMVAAYKLRRLYDRLTGRRHRHSIFFTYGRDNRFTEQFSSANWVRQDQQNRASDRLPSALAEALRREGVTLAGAIEVAN